MQNWYTKWNKITNIMFVAILDWLIWDMRSDSIICYLVLDIYSDDITVRGGSELWAKWLNQMKYLQAEQLFISSALCLFPCYTLLKICSPAHRFHVVIPLLYTEKKKKKYQEWIEMLQNGRKKIISTYCAPLSAQVAGNRCIFTARPTAGHVGLYLPSIMGIYAANRFFF